MGNRPCDYLNLPVMCQFFPRVLLGESTFRSRLRNHHPLPRIRYSARRRTNNETFKFSIWQLQVRTNQATSANIDVHGTRLQFISTTDNVVPPVLQMVYRPAICPDNSKRSVCFWANRDLQATETSVFEMSVVTMITTYCCGVRLYMGLSYPNK